MNTEVQTDSAADTADELKFPLPPARPNSRKPSLHIEDLLFSAVNTARLERFFGSQGEFLGPSPDGLYADCINRQLHLRLSFQLSARYVIHLCQKGAAVLRLARYHASRMGHGLYTMMRTSLLKAVFDKSVNRR